MLSAPRALFPAVAAALLALPACAVDEAPSPAPIPLNVAGGLRASIEDSSRLVIAAGDGRVLLDGLPPGPIGPDDAPLVGFAVRDLTTTYEMEVGSFRPTDVAGGPWRSAAKLLRGADGASIDVADAAGKLLARVAFRSPEEGHLIARVTPGDGPERRLSWGFACDDKDHFAGFGAQSLDVDHRGFTVPTFVQEQGIGKAQSDLYQSDWPLVGRRHNSQVPIPEYLSRRGYILTVDTPLRAIFALCSEKETAARVEIEMPAEVHLFDGPSPAQAIARATAAFGRPRLPPRVAFAPWIDALYGSDNVRAVAKKLRSLGVPSSVIWTEDWRGGEWSGDNYRLKEDWDVDTSLYPDMPALTGELHAEGFDFFVYYNPFIYKGSKAWAETQPNGYLIKRADGSDYVFTGATLSDTSLIDLDNPAARGWAVAKMRGAIALGADGWMNDFGEWLPTDATTFAGPSLLRHNLYTVAWQQTAREAIDGVNDGQERLFFGRSGWLGTPPLADVIWAGDQRTDFEPDDGMPSVLPIGIGLGLVGISTFGHDIAGYQSATNPTTTKELFFRWTELGAWSPVMRTHHGTKPKLSWSWQSDDESIAHFKRYAELHIALYPTLSGLARVASDTGLPMWRGLMIATPEDKAVWPITDEVMLGDGLLLAPVMTDGATSRAVYLPRGRWYPWAGGASLPGEASITAPAPLGEMPVFARAGTVVPMLPGGVMTLVRGSPAAPDASSVGDDRVVMVFLGDAGRFEEASGLTYTLDHVGDAAGALSLAWSGQALAACAAPKVAPCAEAGPDGATASVTGAGVLSVSAGEEVVARLTVKGGAAGRKLTLVVRGP